MLTQECTVKRLHVQYSIRTLRRGAFLPGDALMLLLELVVGFGLFGVSEHSCTEAMRLSESRSRAVKILHVDALGTDHKKASDKWNV